MRRTEEGREARREEGRGRRVGMRRTEEGREGRREEGRDVPW
jgi:hypothetical protein